jgi:hypothetical protein
METSEQLILARYKDKFTIFTTTSTVRNSYTKVKITQEQKDYILGKFTTNVNTQTIFKSDIDQYKRAEEVLKFINRENMEERVEDKLVITDRHGTSKLILSTDKTKISIAKRRIKKDGTIENSTKTPGTCYIDNETREKFFKAVKETVGPTVNKYSTNYILYSYQGHIFDIWREAMEREYTRLCNK